MAATTRMFLLLLWLTITVGNAQTGGSATMSKAQILGAGEKLADAQLTVLQGHFSNLLWEHGVMWAGYADFTRYSGKPAYLEALTTMGQTAHWTPPVDSKQPFNADFVAIGQAFLEMSARTGDPAILAPLRARLDAAADCFLHQEQAGRFAWNWCDTLFMGGPVLARMSTLTHESKYLDALDAELGRMADLLYDLQEHLYYRDKGFVGKRTKNGQKVFWSRGNGWVFAGLAKLLPDVPASDPARARYVTIFQEMAARLASLQQPDGTWHPSLLDPEEFPDAETSGTALDCYAFAWGINHELLDRKTYLPVAARAWAALLAARRPDGLLGFVQGVSNRPDVVREDHTVVYATGQFLLAAGELSQLAPIQVPPLPKLTTEPPPLPPAPRLPATPGPVSAPTAKVPSPTPKCNGPAQTTEQGVVAIGW